MKSPACGCTKKHRQRGGYRTIKNKSMTVRRIRNGTRRSMRSRSGTRRTF
jgi:hypothetical protein